MREKVISTDKAVQPVGPYSQAVRAGDLLYISGTVPIDPKTGEVVEREIRTQTRVVMENIRAILEAAGGTMNDLVKVNVHLSDAKDWPVMNEVYRSSSATTCRREWRWRPSRRSSSSSTSTRSPTCRRSSASPPASPRPCGRTAC